VPCAHCSQPLCVNAVYAQLLIEEHTHDAPIPS
jgi:hypothetical protein